MSKGKIIQVMGPVVDVAFEDDGLPISRMPWWWIIRVRSASWKWPSM